MKIFSAQLKGTTIVVSGSSASITGSFTGSIAGIDINETNQFTASTIARLNSIETISSSNDSRVNSLESFTSSTELRLDLLETHSESVNTTNTAQNSRLDSLENLTGSLATTGSNTFYGQQVFSGSLYVQDNLIVQGSSSLQNITASAVSIGTNIVYLNTDTPAVRFAGLTVQDSGSSAGVTGSMLWDSLCNRWIYSNPSTVGYSGGMLLSGPRAANLGEETTLTCNYIAKSGGGDHLYNSCIYDNGGNVGIGNISPVSTSLTGSLTLYKSHNNDIASVPSTSAQAYYGNQSSLYLFGRNSGISIIAANSEEGSIKFGNAEVANYATIATSTGNSSIGGDMYFRVGTDTERIRIFNTGITCFSCQICAPNVSVTNCLGIGTAPNAGYILDVYQPASSTTAYARIKNNRTRNAALQLETNLGNFLIGVGIGTDTNQFQIYDNTSGINRLIINGGGCVGINASTPCSLLSINCVSNGGDSLYVNMFTITTDVSNVYNHLGLSPTSLEYRREAQTGVDLCIKTFVCNGSSGGNIIFAPNLESTSFCSYPRMKIQQNGFIGIGAFCAQTYLHICDNLSAGRDDLVRIQTTMSTNHAWYRSTSCAGVNFIAGANRSNNDGNIRGGAAIIGTTTNHNLDIHTNGIRRMTINNSGGVSFIGNSQDYPTVALCGPTYTMIAMGDRTSSSGTDVGYLSIYNQGGRVIDLPGNSDNIYFCTGGRFVIGRSSFCEIYSFANSEICNGQTWLGPLDLGNSGGGTPQSPLYEGGGKRWNFGWDSGALNAITSYNNCTPILMGWGANDTGSGPSGYRKFCFNYSGNAYSTGGTWGTMSSNCIIKTCITGANSQWSDIKNICIVNYKMKEEIEEYGDSARIHLGVVVEQVAEVSPGLLEEGGYNCKWQTCLTGVKTSILHMKAVKALQEAMCRIEVLESCLGLS
jgi:hypothetical protein